jgi:hypothetical protein
MDDRMENVRDRISRVKEILEKKRLERERLERRKRLEEIKQKRIERQRPAGQAQAHLGNVLIIIRVVYGQDQPGDPMEFTLNETDTVSTLKKNVINEIMSRVDGLRPQIIEDHNQNFLNNFRFYLEGRIIEDNQTIKDIIPEQDRDVEEPMLHMLFKGDLPGYQEGGKSGRSKRRKSKRKKSKKKRKSKTRRRRR